MWHGLEARVSLDHGEPDFAKSYDPNIGICIEDIPGGKINDTYGGEKVIYFSETINEDAQEELTDIFYQMSPKYSKKLC